jgi:predicted Zn-dependent protease
MLEQLLATLEKTVGVNDWRVRRVRTWSNQYYLARRRPENERATSAERYEVEIYSDHPAADGGAPSRGSATLTLVPGDEVRLAERVQQGVFMASLTDNPPYSLPGPEVYPQVLTADRLLQVEPAQAARRLGEDLLAASAGEPGISLASAEVYVDRADVLLRNSRGVQAQQEETSLLVDFVLLAKGEAAHGAKDGAGVEMEAHTEVRRRALSELDLSALVRRQSRYARDTLRASTPATGRYPVIVSDDALRDLLAGMFVSPFAFRSSAQYKYQRLSPWEVGQSIFGDAQPTGDALTLYANAVLPWGLGSACFDADGLPGRRLLLIENGVLRSFWATQRYADYLHVPPTGAFGNLEVMPGSMQVADMWGGDAPLYHIVAFSSMSPDPVTGNFVGEIRLGYERIGNEVRPIRGGSLSGNVFTDLATARLSQEMAFLGNYLGPQAVRFPALTVSGA